MLFCQRSVFVLAVISRLLLTVHSHPFSIRIRFCFRLHYHYMSVRTNLWLFGGKLIKILPLLLLSIGILLILQLRYTCILYDTMWLLLLQFLFSLLLSCHNNLPRPPTCCLISSYHILHGCSFLIHRFSLVAVLFNCSYCFDCLSTTELILTSKLKFNSYLFSCKHDFTCIWKIGIFNSIINNIMLLLSTVI